jgi:hypothetical protein
MPRNDDAPNTGWQTAVEVGSVPKVSYPFQSIGSTSAIQYERAFVQHGDYWSPLALDTADATYTSAFLIEETFPQDIGNGLVKWRRKFATVPSSFTSYDYDAYTFVGYYASYEDSTNFRSPIGKTVPVTISHTFSKTSDPATDFAVVGPKFGPSNNRGELVGYVDANTDTTYTTYTGWVSAGTLIYIKNSSVQRCYGAGNIWHQQTFQTGAQ